MRKTIKTLVLFLLVALMLLSGLAQRGRGLVQLPQSTVAIVRSSKANATDLQYSDIKAMVTEAVRLAGGLSGIVRNGDVVVIKPNLVVSRSSPEVNGVTTDYRVVRAVVELVREINPNGKIYVMEGSSQNTRTVMQALYYDAAHIPGVDQFIAIEEDSGAWQDFNSPGLVRVSLPNGLLHTEYYLNRKYKEANVVISVANLKTHQQATVTGAIKNVGIGATPANIYGNSSTDVGRHSMVNHNSTDLQKWIHDFYLCRPVDFAIIDGLQGVENGPSSDSGMNRRRILA